MLTLAIDTSLKTCSAALVRDGLVLAVAQAPMEKGHAEHLPPMVAALFAEGGAAARDLDRIGVVVGPGSFAGVRVGLAFARSFVLGGRADVAGVTSLEALAVGVGEQEGLRAAIIDARRGQVYAALYDVDGKMLEPPFVAAPADAGVRLAAAAGGRRTLLVGDGALFIEPVPGSFAPSGAPDVIDPAAVARLAAGAPAPKMRPGPLYLRPPDAVPASPSPFEGLLGGRAL